jgi:adenosylcobinamide kinase/adenosylcobinamide-phosphate guanylyltransferase
MANELFAPEGAGSQAVESILSGIIHLEAQCLDLIVVTNDVFAGGQDFQDDTMRYVETLGILNREISRRFDCVIEVVCGIPIVLKGGTL